MSFGENEWDEYWNKQGQGFGAERVAGEKYVTEEKERNQSNASCLNTSTSMETPE